MEVSEPAAPRNIHLIKTSLLLVRIRFFLSFSRWLAWLVGVACGVADWLAGLSDPLDTV